MRIVTENYIIWKNIDIVVLYGNMLSVCFKHRFCLFCPTPTVCPKLPIWEN